MLKINNVKTAIQDGIGIPQTREQLRSTPFRRQDTRVNEENPASVAIGEVGKMIVFLNGIMEGGGIDKAIETLQNSPDPAAQQALQLSMNIKRTLDPISQKIGMLARQSRRFVPMQGRLNDPGAAQDPGQPIAPESGNAAPLTP